MIHNEKEVRELWKEKRVGWSGRTEVDEGRVDVDDELRTGDGLVERKEGVTNVVDQNDESLYLLSLVV